MQYRAYLSKQGFDLWQFVLPLILIFLVKNFGSWVVGPVNRLMSVVDIPAGSMAYDALGDYKKNFFSEFNLGEILKHCGSQKWQTFMDAVKNHESVGVLVTKFFEALFQAGGFVETVNNTLSTITGTVLGLLFKALGFITLFVAQMCAVFVKLEASIFKAILVFVGPLSFAFSVWQPFRGTMKLWFERYVEFCLWCPICSLLFGISIQVANLTSTQIAQIVNAGGMVNVGGGITTAGQGGYDLVSFLVVMAMNLFICFLVTKTKTIASWVIESVGGDGGVGDAIKSTLTGAAGKAAGAVAGKM